MSGGKIGWQRFKCRCHAARESYSSATAKQKPSSDRGRPPRFLRISPIDSGQQIAELRRGDRHRSVGRVRPQEPAPFQPLREQAGPLPSCQITSIDCRCGHESKTGDRSADRAAALPEPAATSSQNPSSYRCGRSPARPARRSEPRSWSFQNGHNPRQRRRINASVHDHPTPARQHNLYPARRRYRRWWILPTFKACRG